MYVYKGAYERIHYLNGQNENFLAWICPLLNQVFIPVDQYVYYESDQVYEIFFQTQGMSGFVLPFRHNIVYINIYSGSYFGEIDFAVPAKKNNISIEHMVDQINLQNFNLVR